MENTCYHSQYRGSDSMYQPRQMVLFPHWIFYPLTWRQQQSPYHRRGSQGRGQQQSQRSYRLKSCPQSHQWRADSLCSPSHCRERESFTPSGRVETVNHQQMCLANYSGWLHHPIQSSSSINTSKASAKTSIAAIKKGGTISTPKTTNGPVLLSQRGKIIYSR